MKLWEDIWFGHCCLATQFWDLYTIANEQNCSIAELWDGVDLKNTFHRTFNSALMLRWYEFISIMLGTQLTEDDDAPIWMFNPTRVYSVKSFYAIINNGGVQPVHSPAVWNITVPPKIHVFLWLLANNKQLTMDNLAKKRQVDLLVFSVANLNLFNTCFLTV